MEPLDRSNPEYWHWRFFYYNPADTATWVPKRYGIGYTLNYAHRSSWIISFAILAFTVGTFILAVIFDQ